MKNITIEVWKKSPAYLKENGFSGDYYRHRHNNESKYFDVSPIVKIITDYFIWDYVERMLREPPRPIIFKKDLSNLKNTI